MKKEEGWACRNNHRLCAERRLLYKCLEEARRHDVPSHNLVHWLHRKNKGVLTIMRWRTDGSWGCSVPCILCRRELIRYGFPVRCFTSDGHWFDGYMDDPDAPSSKPTKGQARMISRG